MRDLRKQRLPTRVADFKDLTLQSRSALRHSMRPVARERGQERTGRAETEGSGRQSYAKKVKRDTSR